MTTKSQEDNVTAKEEGKNARREHGVKGGKVRQTSQGESSVNRTRKTGAVQTRGLVGDGLLNGGGQFRQSEGDLQGLTPSLRREDRGGQKGRWENGWD